MLRGGPRLRVSQMAIISRCQTLLSQRRGRLVVALALRTAHVRFSLCEQLSLWQ